VADHGAVFCVGLTARDAELEKSLQEAKIPWVDLTTDLRAEGDFHWGPEGHTFAAERIDQFLATNKFLQTQGLK
jgi:hypothetical protein